VLGGLISLAEIASLPFVLDSASLTALASFGRDFGFGLLTPCGQMFAQAVADEDDRKRAVGMFTAMFLIPTFFGPAIAEASLHRFGEPGYFGMTLLPILLGLFTAMLLPRTEIPAPPNTAGYLGLLRDRRSWLPNISAMQSGLAFTFANSFLPLMLSRYAIPVAAFFTPLSVVLLLTRFVGMQYLQRLPAARLMMLGLIAYASGTVILASFGADVTASGFAGSLYGLGYGIIIPTAIDWLAGRYPPAERARPVALINTSFQVGAIISMQLTGIGLAAVGWPGILGLLASVIFVVFVVILSRELPWHLFHPKEAD